MKVWYGLQRRHGGFDSIYRRYLQALLLTGEHGKAVLHFQRRDYYCDLLGVDRPSQRKRARGGLQSFADDDWVEDELSRLQARPRRTRRRLLRAIEEDWSAEEEDLCAPGNGAASEEAGPESHHGGSDDAR